MNYLKQLLLMVCTVSPALLCAQQSPSGNILLPIGSDPIELSYYQTTSLSFPAEITGVDRGSADILVQKAAGADNILQLKAAQECFEPTNLTVITGDGKLYNFSVSYNAFPAETAIALNSINNLPKGSLTGAAKSEVQSTAKTALLLRKERKGPKASLAGVAMQVKALYVKEGVMYLKLSITNSSAIDYDIDALRFFIRDQKKSRRTASQEILVEPILIQEDVTAVAHDSQRTIIVAIPKFTIPDKKLFCIELMEKGGGRHLDVKLKHRYIFKATPIGQ